MAKGIAIDISKCTGCGYCELACSFTHHEEFNPLKSRVRVSVFSERSMAVPVVCYQCEEPWCAKACPAGALAVEKDQYGRTSVVTVLKDRCVGCRMCTLACPFGCVVVSDGCAEKCNLCHGDPQCVRRCRTGAIRFMDVDAQAVSKKRAVAERLLGSIQEV
jgi:carbon-monoxide dehydrogenase iron sulfur subunit